MRYEWVITAALGVHLLASIVDAAQLQHEVGEAKVGGDVGFTLKAPDGTELKIKVHISWPNLSADDKAAAIQKDFDNNNHPGWEASRTGNKLTFWHVENGQRKAVDTYLPKTFVDDAEDEAAIHAVQASVGCAFEFGLDGSQLAGGVDNDGNPSFVFVSTTQGAATVSIQPGDCAEDLIMALSDQLQSAGVVVMLTSPTSFMILDLTPDAAVIDFQITDGAIPVDGCRAISIYEIQGQTERV